MGFQFYRRYPVNKRTWLNLSKSGVSASVKVSDNVTVNSRGRLSIRLAKGFWWRSGR